MSTQANLLSALESLKTRAFQQYISYGLQPDAILQQQQNWTFPAYTMNQISDYIDLTKGRIGAVAESYFESDSVKIRIDRLLPSINAAGLPNVPSDADAVMGSLIALIQLVNANVPNPRPASPKVDWDDVKKDGTIPKDLSRRLRSIASQLQILEPKSEQLSKQIAEIESAHDAAEQLPTDMEELSSHRESMRSIVKESKEIFDAILVDGEKSRSRSQKLVTEIERVLGDSRKNSEHIVDVIVESKNMIKLSEQALRGSTGVGLANAFENRKDSLSRAGSLWVVGLILALTAALLIGQDRVVALRSVLDEKHSSTIIWVNTILALLGIGGPIWFAWLSTKQIWTNFRLAEDYAFKASVSKAYEGYRKEAVELDPQLRTRLFATALTRIEEAPIRLMEGNYHGTPLQELLSNPSVVRAIEGVPGLAEKIVNLIKNKGVVEGSIVGGAAAVTGLNSSGKQLKKNEAELE